MAETKLVDAHTHLHLPQFDHDREAVIERAIQAGVGHIITAGIDVADSAKAVELAERYEPVFATVGIHPHQVSHVDPDPAQTYDALRRLLKRPKVVALGEIGLDYVKPFSPPEVQRQRFREQIALAREFHLPLVVHNRGADQDLTTILREEGATEVGGILHCFDGSEELAQAAMSMGFYLSFSGMVTFRHAERLREIVKTVPSTSLLIETDAPYLSPEPRRGRRNEPSHVRHVAEEVARLRGLSYEDVVRATAWNVHRLFGLGEVNGNDRIVYQIRRSLYVNLTNRCTSECDFCARTRLPVVQGHNLSLKREPSVNEVLVAIGDPCRYDEVVFCGYGEPLLRLQELKAVAQALKAKGVRVRLNTNGHGNLIHKRNIVPELRGLIDAVCVSLNAEHVTTYTHLCHPAFGPSSYEAVKAFVLECKQHLPEVTVSVVAVTGVVDLEACRRVANEELGVPLRIRPYNLLG